jgi:hypothetical protein
MPSTPPTVPPPPPKDEFDGSFFGFWGELVTDSSCFPTRTTRARANYTMEWMLVCDSHTGGQRRSSRRSDATRV